jgi:Leucine Rich Repeat (LRR) protein
MSDALPTRRRWLRMSLRTLLALVTVFGVWLGFQVAAAKRQRDALRVLDEAGQWGHFFDYQCSPAGPPKYFTSVPNAVPPAPQWLRNLAGEDAFRTVYFLQWEGAQRRSGMREAELAAVGQLTDLRLLGLIKANVVVEGSAAIRPLNDADLARLARLTKLEWLELEANDFDGTGFASLQNMKQLKCLQLALSHFTDAGMQELAKLTTLESLTLVRVYPPPDSLKHLTALKELRFLDLSHNEITDSDLEFLSALTKLQFLNLRGTRVSRELVDRLKQRPNLSIQSDFDPGVRKPRRNQHDI